MSLILGAIVKTTITALNNDNLSFSYNDFLCIAFSLVWGPRQCWTEAELAVVVLFLILKENACNITSFITKLAEFFRGTMETKLETSCLLIQQVTFLTSSIYLDSAWLKKSKCMPEIRRLLLAFVSRNLENIRTIGSVEVTQIKFANICETFKDTKNVNLHFWFLKNYGEIHITKIHHIQ